MAEESTLFDCQIKIPETVAFNQHTVSLFPSLPSYLHYGHVYLTPGGQKGIDGVCRFSAYSPTQEAFDLWVLLQMKSTGAANNRNKSGASKFRSALAMFAQFQRTHNVRCVLMFITQQELPRSLVIPTEVGLINNESMTLFSLPNVLHRFQIAATMTQQPKRQRRV